MTEFDPTKSVPYRSKFLDEGRYSWRCSLHDLSIYPAESFVPNDVYRLLAGDYSPETYHGRYTTAEAAIADLLRVWSLIAAKGTELQAKHAEEKK